MNLPMILALAALSGWRLWYAAPILVTVSLVYSATRHERMEPILKHALRFGLWVLAFMIIVMIAVMALSHFQ